MNLQKNQLVQVRFNNGIFFDAIIESWSDEKSVLRLPNSDDIVLIQNTLRDVLLVRVINNKKEEQPPISENKTEIINEFEELLNEPKSKPIIEKIADLKIKLNLLEREELQSKTISFEGTGVKQVNYGLPINGITINSPKEAPVQNIRSNTSLHDLFRKKY